MASLANAVDDKRLWLPGNYASLFIELKRAAVAAEKLDRCISVEQGTIDLDDSSSEHPVYRILCRQDSGRTYNEMVDGISFATLTTKIVIPVEVSEDELETLRLIEEKRKQEALEVRIAKLGDLCETAIKEKTRLMKNVIWLTTLPISPGELEESSAKFTVDFNAKDVRGGLLRYQAVCHFSQDDQLKLRVSGRKS